VTVAELRKALEALPGHLPVKGTNGITFTSLNQLIEGQVWWNTSSTLLPMDRGGLEKIDAALLVFDSPAGTGTRA
jgi:hypothetical protein